MHSIISTCVAFAALAALPVVSAHGYIMGITVGNKFYDMPNDPLWIEQHPRPSRAGWYAKNQDFGFVTRPDFPNVNNIACHKDGQPGNEYIAINAGQSMDIQWNGRKDPGFLAWATPHKGPIIDSLARCKPDCTTAKPADLDFFVFGREGMLRPPKSHTDMGWWASDIMRTNNDTWTLTIPHNIPSGNYVLRHEIIALQGAWHGNPQNYPMCVNLKVMGAAGAKDPCMNGAVCRTADKFYKASDPGLNTNIHPMPGNGIHSYIIPGPPVWQGAKRMLSRAFRA